MAEPAEERLVRLLGLLAYLDSVHEASLDELAERFSVTPQQIRKDIDVLWLSGTPRGLPQDLVDFDGFAIDQGIVRLQESQGLSKTFRFTERETLALAICLMALRAAAIGQDGQATNDLITQTLAALHQDGRQIDDAIDIDWQDPIAPSILETLRVGLREARQVAIDYTDAADTTEHRVIEPLRLVNIDGRGYLDAWCTRAEGSRRFRIDRVRDAQILDESIRHEVSDLDLPDDGTLIFDKPTVEVRLHLRASGRAVPETVPYDELVEHVDGSFTVHLQVASRGWLRRLILEHADHIVAVYPPEVAAEAAADAQHALDRYRVG